MKRRARAIAKRKDSRATPRFLARFRAASVALAVLFLESINPSAHGADTAEAASIFNQRCTACHTFGNGIKVGPDLKNVNERHERPWLLRFIRGSSIVIASGDPAATALFAKFNQTRMPDWSDLSEDQVNAILDWFAADGPEHQQPPEERSAKFATPADIEGGRAIFRGTARLASGGLPCATCHAVSDGASSMGGTLGPDLSTTYPRYQDKFLTTFLRHPCFRRSPDSSAGQYLAPEEIFALKAYLRNVAPSNSGR
jgi:mono/diheme cytochrome c family protein